MNCRFFFIFSALAVVSCALAADTPETGDIAPAFKIMSGADKILTKDMIEGKTAVIVYETREVVEKNRSLKEALKRFHFDQPQRMRENMLTIPVINCSSAVWPFTRIWKSQLRKHSEKEDITIYGDWDGQMFADYQMEPDESNVLIIDRNGFIRYRRSGRIGADQTEKIKELLSSLLRESAGSDYGKVED